MTGRRDSNIYPLQGQIIEAGTIGGPLHPTSGGNVLVGALGQDSAQAGNAVAGTVKTGTVLAAAAGATSLTYTITGGSAAPSGGGGEYFQIGPAINTVGSAAIAVAGTQVTKTTSVTGGGPYTLTIPALQMKVDTTGNGGAGLVAQSVVAPFWHALAYSNTLPSYTIEKNVGGHQSVQYRGCRVNKLSLKSTSANEPATFVADVVAQQHTILGTPTAVTDDTSIPWVAAEAALSTPNSGGTNTANISIEEFTLDIENGLKSSFTLNQSHFLAYLTAASFKVAGTFKAVWTSFNDTDWGYFTNALAATTGSLSFTLTHAGGGAEVLTITVPSVNLTKYKDDVKTKDIVISNLTFETSLKISTGARITATLVNQVNTQL